MAYHSRKVWFGRQCMGQVIYAYQLSFRDICEFGHVQVKYEHWTEQTHCVCAWDALGTELKTVS